VIGILQPVAIAPEIGPRCALGAARRHIATQFTAEALILSALDGARGILAGLLITAGYAHTRHWRAAIPPAIRAAQLSPTDALRGTT
jgi:putative ABC transport system permease protein